MTKKYEPTGPVSRFVNSFEEVMIALLLGLMTMLTFINVVLRYFLNESIIWGLEVTSILFAWLVLFGISYCVKINAHLGVDAVINLFSASGRKVLTIIAGGFCILYAFLVLKGGWDFWAPYAGLNATSGRVIPTGFQESRDLAFYMTDQVPVPFAQEWLENTFNYGEEYDKLPRFIPYFILPFGAALLLFRFVQSTIWVIQDKRRALIVSHEAEEAVDEVSMRYEEID